MLPVRDNLPTRSVPIVNYSLIALNVAAFGLETWVTAGGNDVQALANQWTLVPSQLIAHPWASAPSLLTHMFLHGGLAHVAGNMLFLWIFGDNVEDVLGHARYALFYFLCGIAAALGQVAASPHSTVPMLGASGAISGVLAAYAILYPRSPIEVVNPIPILWFFWGFFLIFPAWLVLLEFFVANLWHALQPSNAAGGVAFVAHVSGFVAGALLLPLLRTQQSVEYRPWQRWVGQRRERLAN